ncbi:ABC transporter permease [Megalodesulfovibrio gigas]|nr:ABC transporter permease [Megalodesulfovibrio gigas]
MMPDMWGPLAMFTPLLAAAIQSGAPILFATVGEIVTERSGTLNLGVEGMMLCGALAAFVVSLGTGSPWLGALAGCAAGSLLAVLHGLSTLTCGGNQVVSGLALTILGVGLADTLGAGHIGQVSPGFDPVAVPLLSTIPVLGPALFNQDPLVYLSYVMPLAVWLLLCRTRWGLHLQAAGENPAAARAAGISPLRWRWIGILAGGALCGLGGAYLSLAATHLWTTNLTAGRGWIAVALVIFSAWRPERAMLGAYLFGGVMALQLRLQAMGAALPSSLLLMMPYAMTVLALVVFSRAKARAAGRNLPPASLGVPLGGEGG